MSKLSSFLKLNNRVLNPQYICDIKIYKDVYHIKTISNHQGFIFAGFGMINADSDTLEVSKEKNEDDYNKINEWLSKIE